MLEHGLLICGDRIHFLTRRDFLLRAFEFSQGEMVFRRSGVDHKQIPGNPPGILPRLPQPRNNRKAAMELIVHNQCLCNNCKIPLYSFNVPPYYYENAKHQTAASP